MRVIDAFDSSVRTVVTSPDGRFLAAASERQLAVLEWWSGAEVCRVTLLGRVGQLAFTTDGNWVVFTGSGGLNRLATGPAQPIRLATGEYSGAVATSPDGRTLAATRSGRRAQVKLDTWELPSWRPKTGFDFWSPFERLAYSPNGEFLAGIEFQAQGNVPHAWNERFRRGVDRGSFELRIAVSGGLNGRDWPFDWPTTAFLAFPRHSETVVYGWDAEFQVMETRAGNVLKRVKSPGKPFVDATFTGAGRHLASVDGTALMRLWSADSWEVIRGYDWESGPLTCITATADGLGGVCGTDSGKLVVFDVDE